MTIVVTDLAACYEISAPAGLELRIDGRGYGGLCGPSRRGTARTLSEALYAIVDPWQWHAQRYSCSHSPQVTSMDVDILARFERILGKMSTLSWH